MEATGWPIRLGPAGGPAVRVHGEERTTGRRRPEEIKGGPSKDRSDPGAYRRGECEKSRNRAGGPPAGSPARYQRGLSFTLSALSSLVQLRTRVIIIESAGCIDAVDRDTLALHPDTIVRYLGKVFGGSWL